MKDPTRRNGSMRTHAPGGVPPIQILIEVPVDQVTKRRARTVNVEVLAEEDLRTPPTSRNTHPTTRRGACGVTLFKINPFELSRRLKAQPQPIQRPLAMATVEKKASPGKTDPFGTGKILVTDCFDKFSNEQQDPFLMLHHFGPAPMKSMPQFGMHPHRGFNEVPYLKQGRWLATDPWNMQAAGEDAVFAEGQLQWGKCGSGIEHGMKFDATYDGPVQGFQLWINLRSENKLDPPEFQNARSDALPLIDVAPKAKAKLLVGELQGQTSPVDSQGIHCQYVDYMLEPGAEVVHPRAAGMSTLFVYADCRRLPLGGLWSATDCI